MSAVLVEGVSKSFPTAQGAKAALEGVSLRVEKGECAVISGENGSGKSLLMSIIAGLEEPDEGRVETEGRVGLVFQEADTQILGETVREDVSLGPKNQKMGKKQAEEAANSALEKVGLLEKADFPARFLSGGEKRRLAVACMLAMDLQTIILDEPYANLDFGGVRQVNALIRGLKAEGRTVIILTHELEKCLGLAQRFFVLFRGKIAFAGSPTEGLAQDLERWNVRNPLGGCASLEEMAW